MIYGYIRISTDKQTAQNQRFEIEEFAGKNNIIIDQWIAETISSTKSLEKRKLGTLLANCRKATFLSLRNCHVWEEICFRLWEFWQTA